MSLEVDLEKLESLYAKIDLLDRMAKTRWEKFWWNVFKACFRKKPKIARLRPARQRISTITPCKRNHPVTERYRLDLVRYGKPFTQLRCRDCDKESQQARRERKLRAVP